MQDFALLVTRCEARLALLRLPGVGLRGALLHEASHVTFAVSIGRVLVQFLEIFLISVTPRHEGYHGYRPGRGARVPDPTGGYFQGPRLGACAPEGGSPQVQP